MEEMLEDFGPEWCQKLLNDPSYEQSRPRTRGDGLSAKDSRSSLMGRTLFTQQTLRAMRYLYKPASPRESPKGSTTADKDDGRIGAELLALISLGDGMCSHANTLHGGIDTMLIDELGGDCAFREVPNAETLMAVNFNVNLRRCVRAPGLVLGRAWIERRPEGRKVFVKVRLEQEERSCIEAEILYLKMKAMM